MGRRNTTFPNAATNNTSVITTSDDADDSTDTTTTTNQGKHSGTTTTTTTTTNQGKHSGTAWQAEQSEDDNKSVSSSSNANVAADKETYDDYTSSEASAGAKVQAQIEEQESNFTFGVANMHDEENKDALAGLYEAMAQDQLRPPVNPQPMSNDAAATDALSDADDSERAKLLRNFGINPLRAMIVGSTEFLPIGTGTTEEYQTTLNINFGEESSISVTQVAKLIELHRQIREYIIVVSDRLLSEKYGDLASLSFRTSAMKYIGENIESVYDDTLDFTGIISSLIEKAVEGISLEETQHWNAVRDDAAESSRPSEMFKKAQRDIASGRTPRATQGTGDPTRLFKRVAARNINNPYFRSLVEYFVYDSIFMEMINYFEEVINLSSTLIEKIGIDKSISVGSTYN